MVHVHSVQRWCYREMDGSTSERGVRNFDIFAAAVWMLGAFLVHGHDGETMHICTCKYRKSHNIGGKGRPGRGNSRVLATCGRGGGQVHATFLANIMGFTFRII